MNRHLLLCLLLVFSAGCSPLPAAPTPTPSAVISVTQIPVVTAPVTTVKPTKPIETATPTLTPMATAVPTFTPIPTPTATFTPRPAKTILLQYGFSHQEIGREGGTELDAYFGLNMPSLVLYTDGQLLISIGSQYREKQLSWAEMCQLLDRIGQTGFLQSDTIYDASRPTLTPTPHCPYCPRERQILIEINGPLHRQVEILESDMPRAAKEVKAVYQLLDSYRPADMDLYEPTRLQLVPDKRGCSADRAKPWPTSLPPILSPDYQYGGFVKTEWVKPILQYFDYEEGPGGCFSDHGEDWEVFVRYLLPHEPDDWYLHYPDGAYPDNAVAIDLPFRCEK